MKHYNELVRHSGNAQLFQAVELSATAMTGGHPFHIHAEGLRGTGKTTIIRAAQTILPPITRIRGCVYNCDPQKPHCPEHRNMSEAQLAQAGTEEVPRPFVEISHAAKIGTVVGSIDLGKLIDRIRPAAALMPGSILRAHRGVLFIDEINRLADTAPELADVLLDVMGTKPGRVQVEETGLPTVDMPVAVSVWAASNPDEDPGALSLIRKQLADRFDLVINMGRPSDYQAVLSILAQQDGPVSRPNPGVIQSADFRQVAVDNHIRSVLAAIYIDFSLESLRAVEALETAARLAALYRFRQAVAVDDIIQVVPLALGHRTDNATLAAILRYLQGLPGRQEAVNLSAPAAKGTMAAAPVETQATQKFGWWSKFWQNLLSRSRTSQPKPAESSRTDDGRRQAAASRAEAAPKIIDPLAAQITAPPNPARPLGQLPLEQYVSGEGQRPHE
ncbi:MAG: ATP-binding protein [Negativicutes bacterium]|nr:ATP-binding protein [Negativicutes bacterium]